MSVYYTSMIQYIVLHVIWPLTPKIDRVTQHSICDMGHRDMRQGSKTYSDMGHSLLLNSTCDMGDRDMRQGGKTYSDMHGT